MSITDNQEIWHHEDVIGEISLSRSDRTGLSLTVRGYYSDITNNVVALTAADVHGLIEALTAVEREWDAGRAECRRHHPSSGTGEEER